MKQYVFLYHNDGHIIIQRSEYIEYGWYIMIIDSSITLWEIPETGNEAQKIGTFKTVKEAIEAAGNLT